MKKTLTLILSLLLVVLLLAGCTTNAPGTDGKETKDNASGEKSTEMQSAENSGSDGEILFGRVKSIVGNEIELELAELTGGEDMGTGTNESGVEEGLSSNIEEEGEADGPSLSIVKDGKMYQFGAGASNSSMELEYLGETRSIIIPTGAEIESLLGAATLASIQKGSVIQITLSEGSDSLAEKVMIME